MFALPVLLILRKNRNGPCLNPLNDEDEVIQPNLEVANPVEGASLPEPEMNDVKVPIGMPMPLYDMLRDLIERHRHPSRDAEIYECTKRTKRGLDD